VGDGAAVRVFVLAVLYCLPTEARPPLSVCDVLDNQAAYLKKTVTVRGKVISYEHGAFLAATVPCEGPDTGVRLEDIDLAGYFAAGGHKGIGVLATVEGKLVMSDRHARGKPATPHLALSVSGILYEKPQRTK
jgi:hypothetical protein